MAPVITKNPWLSIWTEPRQTIRSIVTSNPNYQIGILSWLYGFPMLLHFAQNFSLAQHLSLGMIIIAAAVLAVIVGLVGFTIGSALLFWTGKWIGGKGTFAEIRAAIAWSNVPNIVNTFTWILLMVVFGRGLFSADFTQNYFIGYRLGVVASVFLVQAVMAVWSFILFLKTVGEVQGFSAWKALLNFLIPFFMVLIAMWIVVGVVLSFAGAQ